jgi:molybdenum cofactor cytidylyltransferase
MIFGDIPVLAAEGAILAHSLKAGAQVFRKGRRLSADDCAALCDSGFQTVMAARLEVGDMGEDEAARRIAVALAGPEVSASEAFTGRANLYSQAAGLVHIDTARIAALNAVDEAITLATLAPFERVEPRQMLATVKIIPFAASSVAVETATDMLLAGAPALSVSPFRPKRVALISTTLPDMKEALLVKNRLVLDTRLKALNSAVFWERRVAHRTDALADAINRARSKACDPILIFGASAITDRRDVVPAAIEAAGGRIVRFGMPVDPGNLLLLATLGSATVIGLPGCARSPKANGFDLVLQRVLADVPVSGPDIAAMGVGGLMMEIHSRPQPRDRIQTAPRAPRIAAVVLAAGLSSRMGHNKLLSEIGGETLLVHVLRGVLASSARPVIVVTGHERERVEGALAELPVTLVHNPRFAGGLSTSIVAGISNVPDDCDGAIILLGDMPAIETGLIDRQIAAFAPDEGRAICVATHHGRRGNPVLWSRQFFPEILALTGDIGAKALIAAHDEFVCEIDVDDDGPLLDIDTPDMLAAWRSRST